MTAAAGDLGSSAGRPSTGGPREGGPEGIGRETGGEGLAGGGGRPRALVVFAGDGTAESTLPGALRAR
eukprot:1013983-Pleurochrysis_carterae.AAC.1